MAPSAMPRALSNPILGYCAPTARGERGSLIGLARRPVLLDYAIGVRQLPLPGRRQSFYPASTSGCWTRKRSAERSCMGGLWFAPSSAS